MLHHPSGRLWALDSNVSISDDVLSWVLDTSASSIIEKHTCDHTCFLLSRDACMALVPIAGPTKSHQYREFEMGVPVGQIDVADRLRMVFGIRAGGKRGRQERKW